MANRERVRLSVSVVIPHFNSASTLARAIDSVASQTAMPKEIIVIDDASSAKELAAVREIVRVAGNVRLIELTENRGPASARNRGWDQARGDWVTFLDSDDSWHPRKLEAQMEAARAAEETPILVATEMSNPNSKNILHQLKSGTANSSLRVVKRKSLLFRNSFLTPTVMVERKIPARFPEGERFCEDFALWLEIASYERPMLKIQKELVESYKAPFGESGLSAQMRAMFAGELRAFRRAFESGWITLPEFLFARLILRVRYARRVLRHIRWSLVRKWSMKSNV